MKILVPVKQVQILDEDFEIRDDGRAVDPSYLEHELNEWDDYSWEAALQLMELHEAIEAIPLTVGPEESEEGLRKCLAKGGERAIRVWDENLEGSDQMVVARVIAAVAQKEGADLILAGTQSNDFGHGQTGIATAAMLGWSHVAVVSEIQYEPDSKKLTVKRELEGGVEEELELTLPAVLTIQLGINEPRYASLRGIKQAREKPVATMTCAELGLTEDQIGEAGSSSRIRRIYVPERGKAEIISGTPAEQAKRLLEIINELKGA
ncbi:electron transfer flavoprotein subunit beta/FixA family protein [Chelativorans composti]|jgi:Electron transfer flavoprotein, beta subunit|uniref:Electron transfer flavoprotein subunit beta n=1 Tax=Chelativorans composti TaxID=768533 RepID=A0ABW5DDJ7_9HYPH